MIINKKNKKRIALVVFFSILILLIIFLLNINFFIGHHESRSGIIGKAIDDVPVSENIPGGQLIGKLEIDPETGQPKKIVEAQEKFEKFREQNQTFLWQSWAKIFQNNKYIGPVLNATEKFFSLFNPLWKAVFGTEFSWSWAFFVGLGLWLLIIIIIYFPAKEIFDNSLFALITGFIVASITGFFGILNKAVLFFTPFIKNIWILAILIIFAIVFTILYQKLFGKLKEESEEEELKKAKEAIKAHGKVSRKALEEMGK